MRELYRIRAAAQLDAVAAAEQTVRLRAASDEEVSTVGLVSFFKMAGEKRLGQGQAKAAQEAAAGKPSPQTITALSVAAGIAKKFYGDAHKHPLIFEASKPMLSHPDKIYLGQMLRIPPA
jgi:nucleoid-associated protein YgaU